MMAAASIPPGSRTAKWRLPNLVGVRFLHNIKSYRALRVIADQCTLATQDIFAPGKTE